MATIVTDYKELRKYAGYIEAHNETFSKQYAALFKTVEDLKDSWQGTDNQSYIDNVVKYKDDFATIKKAVDEYVAFMRQSADIYEKTQTTIADTAKKL